MLAANAFTVIGLTACGGGGSTDQIATTPSARSILPVSVSVFVPKAMPGSASIGRGSASSSSLKPRYLPASVNSITFQQTESGGSAVSGSTTLLPIGGASCVASPGGQTCSATLQGALGQDAWLIDSYASSDGMDPALSTNTGTLTVVRGAANTLVLTLNPILRSLAFVPTGDTSNAATANTLPLVLEALDSSGAVIIGPGIFVTSANVPDPVTLSSSSAAVVPQTSDTVPATTTLTDASDDNLGQITYDGTLLAGIQTVSASAAGIPTATFTLTLLASGVIVAPANIAMGADLGTTTVSLPISEVGFPGTFSLTSAGDNCDGIASFPATAQGPSASPVVTQLGGGTCTIAIGDGVHSTSVTVYSTTIGITLQQHRQR